MFLVFIYNMINRQLDKQFLNIPFIDLVKNCIKLTEKVLSVTKKKCIFLAELTVPKVASRDPEECMVVGVG